MAGTGCYSNAVSGLRYTGGVTIVIAGGSGFLGPETGQTARRARATGSSRSRVAHRARGNEIAWQPDGNAGALPRHLDGVDAIVNLAGEGIADKRWTAARKAALENSRILSTRTLVRAVAACARPPRRLHQRIGDWLLRSARRRAGHRIDAAGLGLSGAALRRMGSRRRARSSRRRRGWRSSAPASRSIATAARLRKMLLPFKLGLGATLGSGDQFMPWIHVDDWTAMVSWLIQNDRASGRVQRHGAGAGHQSHVHAYARPRAASPGRASRAGIRAARGAGRDGVGARRRTTRLAGRGGAAWISFHPPRARAGAREPQPLIAQDSTP